MTYYFMLRVPPLTPEVTLVNLPPRNGARAWRGRQLIHCAWSDGSDWRVAVLGEIAEGGAVTVRSTDLGDIPEDALPVLFLSPQPHDGIHKRLHRLDHMNTVPAWRANIRLASPTTSVSFQGEYPVATAFAEGASLLSFAPLIQSGEGATTELLFVNITANPAIETHRLVICAAASGRTIQRADIRTNRCSIVPLSRSDELLVAACGGLTGIPIYFSHDAAFTSMSLEHSHPPIEMVVFGNRGGVSRELKNEWMARLDPEHELATTSL